MKSVRGIYIAFFCCEMILIAFTVLVCYSNSLWRYLFPSSRLDSNYQKVVLSEDIVVYDCLNMEEPDDVITSLYIPQGSILELGNISADSKIIGRYLSEEGMKYSISIGEPYTYKVTELKSYLSECNKTIGTNQKDIISRLIIDFIISVVISGVVTTLITLISKKHIYRHIVCSIIVIMIVIVSRVIVLII